MLPMMAVAQPDDFLRRSEVVLSGGAMNYVGDLNNQRLFERPYGAFSAGLRSWLDNRWALRAEVAMGTVAGGEPDFIELRNLSFRSKMLEVAVMGEFTFWPYGGGATDHQWAPYLFAGAGVFHFNPMASYELEAGHIEWVALQPLHTEGQGSLEYPDRRPYSLTQVCIPFGIGFKWRLGKTFSLSAEYGLRYTLTDYLDDVSKTYVGAEVLQNNTTDADMAVRMADRSSEVQPGYVNAAGIKRGDDSLNDMYAYFHLSLGISLETMFGWMRSKRCR